jgi:hypothetical protein
VHDPVAARFPNDDFWSEPSSEHVNASIGSTAEPPTPTRWWRSNSARRRENQKRRDRVGMATECSVRLVEWLQSPAARAWLVAP